MTAGAIPYVAPGFSFMDFWRHARNPQGQASVIRTTLPHGYHDAGERMLHAAFQVLVDYVECECALEELLEHPDEHGMTLTQQVYVRDPALGCLFLTRRALEPPVGTPEEQKHILAEAELARNIMYLYHWWTEARPDAIDSADETFYSLGDEDQKHLLMLVSLRTKEWF